MSKTKTKSDIWERYQCSSKALESPSWSLLFICWLVSTKTCMMECIHAIWNLPWTTCIRGFILFLQNWYNCVKNVQIRSLFWSVFSRIQSEYAKLRTRKNSVFGHFLWSGCIGNFINRTARVRRFSQIFYDLCEVILDHRLDPSFSKLNTKEKVAYLLYGSRSRSSSLNKNVIKLVIKFLKSTGRFNEPLMFFDQWNVKFPKVFTTEVAIKRCSGKWVFLKF